MATIAEALGIHWDLDIKQAPQHQMTHHARKQASEKGWSVDAVLLTADHPLHTSRSVRYPGQVRHVRNGIVAVIDTASRMIVTVYTDRDETELRSDQTDGDARRYAGRRNR